MPDEHYSPAADQFPVVSSGPLPALTRLRHGDEFLKPQCLEVICRELGIPRPPCEVLSALVDLTRNDTAMARQGQPLKKVREDYRRQLREWMLDPRQRGKVKLVSLPPGSGKTQIAIEVADEGASPGLRIHIVWGMYAVRDQFAGLLDGWLHVEGRSEENCKHHLKARRLGNLGYGVHASLCHQCPDRQGCSYLEAWRKVGERKQGSHKATFVHQMLTRWEVWNCDVLIVDEEFIAACLLKTQFSRGEIEASREGGAACALLRNALVGLLRQVEGLSPEEERRVKLGQTHLDIRNRLKTGIDDFDAVLGQARVELGISDHDRLADLPGAWDSLEAGDRTPKPVMYTVVQALSKQAEWLSQHPDSQYAPLGIELVGDSNRYEPVLVYRNHWTWQRFTRGQQPLLIILDASTPRDLYRMVLGVAEEQIEEYARDVEHSPGFEVWHVPDAVYSKYYLDKGSGTWQAAVHKAEYALLLAGAGGTKIGVATFASWQKKTMQALGVTDERAACHFFGSRGKNDIEDAGVETLVVIGTPNLPGDAAKNMTLALQEGQGDEEELRESIRQVYNIQELEQMCYRLRPHTLRAGDKAKRLIIIGSELPRGLGVADFTVKRLANARSLLIVSQVRAFLKVALAWRYCIARGERRPSIAKLSRLTGCQRKTVKRHVLRLEGMMDGW